MKEEIRKYMKVTREIRNMWPLFSIVILPGIKRVALGVCLIQTD
jgi:hypothetical protein